MKLKNMIASLAACAIAVSGLAMTVSAEELMKKEGNAENAKAYEIPFDGLDLSKLDKIEAVVSCDTNVLNGCIGYNADDGSADGKWTAVNQETKVGDGESVSATWTVDGLAGTVKGGLQVQFWWVQPIYGEDGKETGNGVAKLESVKLLDKDGNELKAAETTTTAAATTTTKAATTTKAGATTKAGTTTAASSKTGDAGVSIAVAGLSLAAVAAFAARKKH